SRRVRSQLRRFAAVGVLVTAVDVVVLAALRLGVGLPVVVADAVAITAAAIVSFLANRALTFTSDPHLRWVDEPFAYASVTAVARLHSPTQTLRMTRPSSLGSSPRSKPAGTSWSAAGGTSRP